MFVSNASFSLSLSLGILLFFVNRSQFLLKNVISTSTFAFKELKYLFSPLRISFCSLINVPSTSICVINLLLKLCFYNLRKYAVLFSPSSTHLHFDLRITPFASCLSTHISEMSKFGIFCDISITIITFIFSIPMIRHSIHILLYLFDLDLTLTKKC